MYEYVCVQDFFSQVLLQTFYVLRVRCYSNFSAGKQDHIAFIHVFYAYI